MRPILLRTMSLIILAVSTLAASGCAVGNTHTFRYAPQTAADWGEKRVILVLGVADLRQEVVSGAEPASWVGEQRSGFGIPFNVTTTNRRPFSEVVQETLQRDLESVGFRTVTLDDASSDSEALAEVMAEAGAQRAVGVVMRNFNSNTYTNIDVEWELEATVYGTSGKGLATNRLEGKETLSGSVVNPPRAAKQRVPPFFFDLVHKLVVNDREMLAALTGATTDPPADGPCTVEQILKMRDAGLSHDQIQAACGS